MDIQLVLHVKSVLDLQAKRLMCEWLPSDTAVFCRKAFGATVLGVLWLSAGV